VNEIIFDIREDEVSGGFIASALGHSILTQAESREELRFMVRDAVNCHFGDGKVRAMPKIIRLLFIRDEILPV
jgi:hypothetical protein